MELLFCCVNILLNCYPLLPVQYERDLTINLGKDDKTNSIAYNVDLNVYLCVITYD